MGLDITSADNKTAIWNGAYTAFRRFRHEIARLLECVEYLKELPLAGIDAKSIAMISITVGTQFTSPAKLTKEMLEHEKVTPGIMAFLLHSDCGGKWSPTECAQIVKLLKPLLLRLPTKIDSGHIGDWGTTTKQFITGLEYCHSNGQNAIFA